MRSPSIRAALAVLVMTLGLAGCARRAVESRALASPQPPRMAEDVQLVPRDSVSSPTPVTPGAVPAAKPRRSLGLQRQAMADTTAAGLVLRRCRIRKLLPEDEATMESVARLLDQARTAFADGDVDRAASSARSAKQLAASMRCP